MMTRSSSAEAGFGALLEGAIAANDTLLCVGLDPEAAMFGSAAPGEDAIVAWCAGVIERTSDLVCCYKPNFAFFEQFGLPGLAALSRLRDLIPPHIPLLLDAKRGDIGSTASAYARAAFEVWRADAVTVSPYLGSDGIAPFLTYPGKTVFVLAQTSNPSAVEIQDHGVEPLYLHVTRRAQTWGDASQVAFVVGATRPAALAHVRDAAPDRWILAPGIGAQGGDLAAALAAGLDSRGSGIIVPVSRAIIGAADPRAAAAALRANISTARDAARRSQQAPENAALALALYDAGCIRFGQFTLASGRQSPVYVDLRRAMSHPEAFRLVVAAYANLLRELDAGPERSDLLAAVPYAALPAAGAVALAVRKPLIYPRKEVKTHGTGQAVEGAFTPGQSAMLIEDVITSGGSILMAAEMLESTGLRVAGAVVLVDREQGGRAALEARGYPLHAVTTISQIMSALLAAGRISAETHQAVAEYLAAGG
jgi:uridine monophosphate synthetase